jgi:hypothetical protein
VGGTVDAVVHVSRGRRTAARRRVSAPCRRVRYVGAPERSRCPFGLFPPLEVASDLRHTFQCFQVKNDGSGRGHFPSSTQPLAASGGQSTDLSLIRRYRRIASAHVSASHTTQRDLFLMIGTLVVALMGDAQPAGVTPIVDRLEAVLDHGG